MRTKELDKPLFVDIAEAIFYAYMTIIVIISAPILLIKLAEELVHQAWQIIL